MANKHRKYTQLYVLIEEIMEEFFMQVIVLLAVLLRKKTSKRKRTLTNTSYSMINKMPDQIKYRNRLIGGSDSDCIANLRMDRNCFGRLCKLLRELGSLRDGKYVTVEEQVAMFLSIISHHKKNRVVQFDFSRSGQTVSNYLHTVLVAILKLHTHLLVRPAPVSEDSTDWRWKWFKGCLGALDGTYISMLVPILDKPRYRSRKGQICTNTLATCDQNLNFIYVLPGWEGSAADSRVLRDAINQNNGFKVPRGFYYLCDSRYANSDGFLAPYRGVRYHLKEWGPECQRPQNPQELFSMQHAKARNVIERAFEIMKMGWGILRSASYYPLKIQNRLIMSCFLLHNFILSVSPEDPIELEFGDNDEPEGDDEQPAGEEIEYVHGISNTSAWNSTRDDIAKFYVERIFVVDFKCTDT